MLPDAPLSPQLPRQLPEEDNHLYFVEGHSPTNNSPPTTKNKHRRRARTNSTDNNPTLRTTPTDVPFLTEGYGFVGAFSSAIACIAYVVWAILPEDFLQKWLSFNAAPSQYWALALPVFVMGALCYLKVVTVAFQLLRTPALHEQSTYCDRHSLEFDEYAHAQQLLLGTPRFMDIPITVVSQIQFGAHGHVSSSSSSSRQSSSHSSKSNKAKHNLRTLSASSSSSAASATTQLRSKSRATIEAENELRNVTSQTRHEETGGVAGVDSGNESVFPLRSPPLLTSQINPQERNSSGSSNGGTAGETVGGTAGGRSGRRRNVTGSASSSRNSPTSTQPSAENPLQNSRSRAPKPMTTTSSFDDRQPSLRVEYVDEKEEKEEKEEKLRVTKNTHGRSFSAANVSSSSSTTGTTSTTNTTTRTTRNKHNRGTSDGLRKSPGRRRRHRSAQSDGSNETTTLASSLSPVRSLASRTSAGAERKRERGSPVGIFRTSSNPSTIGRSRRMHSFRRPGHKKGNRSLQGAPRLVTSQSNNSLKHLAMEFADKEGKNDDSSSTENTK